MSPRPTPKPPRPELSQTPVPIRAIDDVYVALDLEMTGPRPEQQETIEIGAVRFRGNRVVGTWSSLVRPRQPLPYNVQVLTGIRPADLSRAPALEDVAAAFLNFLGTDPVVGHTVSGDIDCLHRGGVEVTSPQVDTHELASVLLPSVPGYGLAALASYFGIPFPTQHRAVADALMTRDVFLRLLGEIGELEISVLREINRLLKLQAWPMKSLFQRVESERRSGVGSDSGSSIRQQLLAKTAGGELPLEVLLMAGSDDGDGRPRGASRPKDLVLSAAKSSVVPAAHSSTAELTLAALQTDEALVLETGPEKGRTAALCWAAAAHSLLNRQPVVVTVDGRDTQNAVRVEIVPELEKELGERLDVTLVKERRNYLCLSRWNALRARQDLTLPETLALVKTLVWLPTTRTGDGTELNLLDEERPIWGLVNTPDSGADHAGCAFGRRGLCYIERLRNRAASSHIVLTDHFVLARDRLETDGMVLPAGAPIVVDECQRLEPAATAALTRSASHAETLTAVRQLDTASGANASRADGIDSLSAAVNEFFERLASTVPAGGPDRATRQVLVTEAVRSKGEWRLLESAWQALLPKLDMALASIPAGPLHALRQLGSMATGELPADQALVVTLAPDRNARLSASPLDVGGYLSETVFSGDSAAVLVSGALSIGGDMTFTNRRLGVAGWEQHTGGPDAATKDVVRVFVPLDIPEPEQAFYQKRLSEAIVELASQVRRRALVLFTSHNHLRQTWQTVNRPLASRNILALGYRVDGTPRRQIFASLRGNPEAILMGDSILWESAEVESTGAEMMVVARIPFASGPDAVEAARAGLESDPFSEFQAPRAALRLKEGCSRVVGTGRQRRAIVILDGRFIAGESAGLARAALGDYETVTCPLADLPGNVAAWLRGDAAF